MIVTKPAIRYMGAKFRLAAWLNPACDAALQRLPGGLWA